MIDDEQDSEPAAASEIVAAPGGKHDATIERWFAAAFHGAPAMRDSDAFNHVRRAVDDLKRRLAQEN